MREPGKTRLVALVAFLLVILSAGCSLVLMARHVTIIDRWLVAGAFLGGMFSMICMARMEYGEWMKGLPWWVRMKDGYRPPIKFPADEPTAKP